MGGPAADLVGYIETMYEYHLPGLKHWELTDEQFVAKWGQLLHIRKEEAKNTAF